tara:strand:- start:39563 stop:39727 length:165 start_codon:yes stop_codon:yes gene_type:complete
MIQQTYSTRNQHEFFIWMIAITGWGFGVTACVRIDQLEKRLAKLENPEGHKSDE